MRRVVLFGCLALLIACTAQEAQQANPQVPTEKLKADSAAAAYHQYAESIGDVMEGRRWDLTAKHDEMTDGEWHWASLHSTNTVSLPRPYEGPQRGTLTLRRNPKAEKAVILQLERGQFSCLSISGCFVNIRFDDDKLERYAATSAANGINSALFIGNYSAFVSRLRDSKRVRIQAEIFQGSSTVFDFSVGGFDPVAFGLDKEKRTLTRGPVTNQR